LLKVVFTIINLALYQDELGITFMFQCIIHVGYSVKFRIDFHHVE